MHLIQLGITDSRHRVELTTEGLEPYHDTLHVFVDASFHQLVPHVAPISCVLVSTGRLGPARA